MGPHPRKILALAVLILAAAQPAPAQQRPADPPAAKAQVYRNEARGFSLAVPPAAELAEREADGAVFIRSRQGYALSVQADDASPDVPLPQMATRMERQQVGPGRMLTDKLGEREITVSGLPAYDATYEGPRTRARMVIARGHRTDFVFLFFAPPRAFTRLVVEFDWVLANFRPAAEEAPEPATAPTAREEREVRQAEIMGSRRFFSPRFGYAIEYPANWVLSRPSAFAILFSGADGTEAYRATVRIQNVQPGATDAASAVAAVVADLKADLAAGARDIQVLGDKPMTYARDGVRLDGRQILVTYAYHGERFKKLAIVVPRPGGGVVHLWSYTAPEAVYDIFRPIAEAMLRSWVIASG